MRSYFIAGRILSVSFTFDGGSVALEDEIFLRFNGGSVAVEDKIFDRLRAMICLNCLKKRASDPSLFSKSGERDAIASAMFLNIIQPVSGSTWKVPLASLVYSKLIVPSLFGSNIKRYSVEPFVKPIVLSVSFVSLVFQRLFNARENSA